MNSKYPVCTSKLHRDYLYSTFHAHIPRYGNETQKARVMIGH
jgi:hypothetical protein